MASKIWNLACGCIVTLDRMQYVQRCAEATRLWGDLTNLTYQQATREEKARVANRARSHAGLTPVAPEGFTGS